VSAAVPGRSPHEPARPHAVPGRSRPPTPVCQEASPLARRTLPVRSTGSARSVSPKPRPARSADAYLEPAAGSVTRSSIAASCLQRQLRWSLDDARTGAGLLCPVCPRRRVLSCQAPTSEVRLSVAGLLRETNLGSGSEPDRADVALSPAPVGEVIARTAVRMCTATDLSRAVRYARADGSTSERSPVITRTTASTGRTFQSRGR